jgi:excinuclease ABC A subunit
MKPARPGNRRASPSLEVVGATSNNLKCLDVEIPFGAATLIIGVSGSGKSSLLADTLATEANARMERFLRVAQDHLERNDVAAFIGPLPVCIHFAQGAFRASQRTTVATCSGLLGILRRLFLKHSAPWAEPPGEPVPAPSPRSYADWLKRHVRGRVTVSAVPLRLVATDGVSCARKLLALGFDTAILRSETDTPARWEQGRVVSLAKFRPLPSTVRHILEVEAGCLTLPARRGEELEALLERAFAAGDGKVVVELHDAGQELSFLQGPRGICLDSDYHHVHPAVLTPFAPPSESLLSFNMPGQERSGACPGCEGIGEALTVPEEALICHPEASLHGGALCLWTEKSYKYVNIQHETVEGLRGMKGFDPDRPWKDLPDGARHLILTGGVSVEDRDRRTGRKLSSPRPFPGFVPAILRKYRSGGATAARLAPLVRRGPCPLCNGTRWSPQARALRVGGLGVAELLAMTFTELTGATKKNSSFARAAPQAARAGIDRIHHLARAFESVGLGHLSGDRGMLTLSEGESRRVRLADLLRARGRGLGLLLDEPARGLHEHDIAGLVESLRELKRSHTLVMNDHRLSLAQAVDHVIELGPGGGAHGGRIVRSGPPAQVLQASDVPELERRRLPVASRHPVLEVRGATLHTLRDVDLRIPLGRLVGITGVSGSGKSSLVRGVLIPALVALLKDGVDAEGFALRQQGTWKSVRGTDRLREVLALDQRSPGTNRRSLVATYLGIAERLRSAFAAVPEAGRLGFKAADFGLNAGKGRCPACLGLGEKEEHGLWIPCAHCGGHRFREDVLAVRLGGLHIADALATPLEALAGGRLPLGEEAAKLLALIVELDLGYLTLGRRMDRLSGGEVQRLRIAHRLWKTDTEGMLLVLDEPSAGLHPQDVLRLLKVLDRIVDGGRNTVLIVEHNVALIRACDWLLDFGPGGGPAGGKLIGQGPPDEVSRLKTPTGLALHRARRRVAELAQSPPKSPPAIPEDVEPERARAARSRLRALLGHEVQPPPPSPGGDEDFEGLAAEPEPDELATARPHEIGGLDREVAILFLMAADSPAEEEIRHVAELWAASPQAKILIHPLLAEMQVWGERIPASVLGLAHSRLEALGLQETSDQGLADLRAGGPRFQPSEDTAAARQAALLDALTLGTGFLELRDARGKVLATLRQRPVDLAEALVAPLGITSASLRRLQVPGRCPACQGSGLIPSLDPSLVMRDHRASPEADAFFTREALEVLKGVRRNVMGPFFRRLEQEELWDRSRSFQRLAPADKDILLHGFWHRPGPGSFLKGPQDDPQEVSSWLRWDGLIRHVREQADRSSSPAWKEAVQRSSRQQECHICEGTGLARHSRVIQRDGRSLHDWTARGTVGELATALRHSPCRTERERRTLARILECLEPVVREAPSARLRDPLADPDLARAVYAQVVRAFTHLGLVRS